MRIDEAAALLSRRATFALLAPLVAFNPRGGFAEPPPAPFEPLPPSSPKITSRASLAIAIGTAEPKMLTVGLYGDEAPKSVDLFRGLCAGTLDGGLTYRGSTGTRVEPDRAIVLGHLSAGSAQEIERSIDSTGYVRSTLVNLAEQYTNDDANALSHDRPGLVSMRKGGGEFEFVLTPKSNPSLDVNRVVIGEVIDSDSLALVRDLNTVPSRKPKAETEAYLAVAKASGDPRARVDQAWRPLQKIQIMSASVLPP